MDIYMIKQEYYTQPLVSVIIPIYNSEQWLLDCLQSLYKQSLSNIEFICVNDGSTDRSRDIVTQFSKKDPRFILINTLNNGPTNARKLGINIAQGKYIGFVDSDDYVTNDYFEKLYKAAQKSDADIVITTRQLRFSKNEKYFFFCGNENYNEISIQDRISYFNSGIIWNKIYKKDFAVFISNKFYKDTYHVCEDNFFTFFALILAKKIVSINTVCYFYRINSLSITKRKATTQMVYNIYYAFENILNKFNNLNYIVQELDIDINDLIYKKALKSRQRADCFSRLKDLSLIEIFFINIHLKDFQFTYNYIYFICHLILGKIKLKINRLSNKYILLNKIKKSLKKIIVIHSAKKNGKYCDTSKITFNNIDICHNNQKNTSPELIVSLTSYPERIKQACYTLHSLLMQNKQPDKIELWLSKEEFKGYNQLPNNLLKLKDHGVKICWTKSNIRSYKKIIPAIKLHPEAIIVTADDDIYYHKDWLKDLYTTWKNSKDLHIIPCHRMHKILLDKNLPLPYDNWLHVIQDNTPHIRHFPTGCGGVLYPPHCFHLDVTREDLFIKLAPTADDLWLWAMASLNGWYAVSVPNCQFSLKYTDILMEYNLNNKKALIHTNIGQKKNDEQFANILKQYPELLNKLIIS